MIFRLGNKYFYDLVHFDIRHYPKLCEKGRSWDLHWLYMFQAGGRWLVSICIKCWNTHGAEAQVIVWVTCVSAKLIVLQLRVHGCPANPKSDTRFVTRRSTFRLSSKGDPVSYTAYHIGCWSRLLFGSNFYDHDVSRGSRIVSSDPAPRHSILVRCCWIFANERKRLAQTREEYNEGCWVPV